VITPTNGVDFLITAAVLYYEASINQLCHWEGRLPRHPAAIDRILAHPETKEATNTLTDLECQYGHQLDTSQGRRNRSGWSDKNRTTFFMARLGNGR
jgi:hypothetical protein